MVLIMENHVRIFAERLKLLREERNLTLIELSEQTGVGVSTLSQYENCQREVKINNLLKLMVFFDVDADWLIGMSDIRKCSKG